MERKVSCVVGIDVGGQSSKIGIVDAAGRVLHRTVLQADGSTDPQVFVGGLAAAVKALVAGSGRQVLAVGVGAPNANYYTGHIAHAPNLPWAADRSVPFAWMLSEALGGLDVTITNDANAAAMGEMTFGVARGMKDFIMITLGTGLGSGIVVNGSLLYGSDGFAGELGHTCAVAENGRLCGCGKRGCLEAYVSSKGVVRTATEWLEAGDEPSELRNCPRITSKAVFEAAERGDALARRVFDYTGGILGRKLADFVHFSAPEAIVLFGGLARAGKYLYEPAWQAMNEHLLAIWKGKVKLLFSSLPESDAAILGASALAWNKLEQTQKQ